MHILARRFFFAWTLGAALLLTSIATISTAEAATLYWVGEDGAPTHIASNWKTTNPTTCGGGNASEPPAPGDTIIFDADCDNGATVSEPLTVTTINMSSGFAGTVSLSAPLVVTSAFTQSAGSFVMNDQTMTISGNVTIGGGTFHAGTGEVILGGLGTSININNSLTFYDLTVNHQNGYSRSIAVGDTLIVEHTLTLADGKLHQASGGSTVHARGDIHVLNAFDGGTAHISITGANDQFFSGNIRRLRQRNDPLSFGYEKPAGTLSISGTLLLPSLTLDDTTGTVRMGQYSTMVLTGNGTPLRGLESIDTTTHTPNSIEFAGDGVTDAPVQIPAGTYDNLTLASRLQSSERHSLVLEAGENNAIDPILDPSTGSLYVSLCTSPATIVKVRTSDFSRVGALTLDAGEDCIRSAAIDWQKGFAYFGTNTSPAKIIKVRLSDFSRVGSLTLEEGENGAARAMALDERSGHLYMATGTVPVTLVKIRLSDFTRVHSLLLDSAEAAVRNLALDPQGGHIYLATRGAPSGIVKVRLSDLTIAASRILDNGQNYATVFVNPGREDVGYIVWISYNRLMKFRLSDLSEIATVPMTADWGGPGALDGKNGYFYAPQYRSCVDKVRLKDFTWVEAICAAPNISTVTHGVALDPEGGFGYIVTTDSPAKIIRFVIGSAFELQGPITVRNTLTVEAASTMHFNEYLVSALGATITNLGTITEGLGKILHGSSLSAPAQVTAGETIALTVTDGDENSDGTVAETVTVTVDGETVTLTETGVATGVFAGSILVVSKQADVRGDGVVSRDADCQYGISVAYRDAEDASDRREAWVTVTDPQVACPPGPGGGRGSMSPGRGGEAPRIDVEKRVVLPQQPETVSPLFVPQGGGGEGGAPVRVASPLLTRLAARVEKRIAQYPHLRTMLLKMLERVERRVAEKK